MSFPKSLQIPDKSTSLIPKTTTSNATQPTTAITYENASSEIQSIRGSSPYPPSTPAPSSRQLDDSSIISDIGLSDYTDDLNNLPSFSFDNITRTKNNNTLTNEEFYDKYIRISKSSDDDEFHHKLKHFFIFSSAGKPIYSMNGSDDVILGYMGILTTIISSFQENFHRDLQVIEFGQGMKIVAVNKSPIILIGISKIEFEHASSIELQLDTLYCYLLSVLSKSAIDKHFNNRLNYDLRRILSPLDFENLDKLCMNLTYGKGNGFELYVSEILLASSRQSTKIRHTLRTKLNRIVSTKNDEVLFSLLVSQDDKILNYVHPKQHNIPNKDLNILLFILNSLPKHKQDKEDLWMPLCMSNFNDHGFLYIFVRRWNNLTLILISGNKNAFESLKQTADELFVKLETKQELMQKLTIELSTPLNIEIPLIFKHFIYKDLNLNQFIMSELPSDDHSGFSFIKCYNELKFNQAKIINFDDNLNYKKLTYFQYKTMIGFMLTDMSYEFYCIIENSYDGKQLQSKKIIEISLQIIKWCKKNHARLFVTI
ncbi:MON1 Vacuolar fusion protein MON1 [Candida maltosa Xu316]